MCVFKSRGGASIAGTSTSPGGGPVGSAEARRPDAPTCSHREGHYLKHSTRAGVLCRGVPRAARFHCARSVYHSLTHKPIGRSGNLSCPDVGLALCVARYAVMQICSCTFNFHGTFCSDVVRFSPSRGGWRAGFHKIESLGCVVEGNRDGTG